MKFEIIISPFIINIMTYKVVMIDIILLYIMSKGMGLKYFRPSTSAPNPSDFSGLKHIKMLIMKR